MVSERRLTVVQVLPKLDSGGVERGTLEVGEYLVKHGHRSIVVSAGGRMVETLTRAGSEHVTWDIGRKSLWTLRLIPRLRRLLEETRADILHVRSRMPAWVGYLAWKGMDPTSRPRFVTTVHGLYSVNAYSAIMLRGERVIAVSKTAETYILDHYPGIDPERIRVIPRGIEASEYPAGYRPPPDWLARWRADHPRLEGKRLLLLPGRITRLKGHADFIHLIDALKRQGLPAHGLIVGGAAAGKTAYLGELRSLTARLGLEDDITFTGTRSDMKDIMAISDLVLSLSTQPESFGRTVLEALSLGIPVIGYDHGGVGEQLARHYPDGAVPLGDRAALEARVSAWLRGAPPPRPALGDSLDDMLRATLDLYHELRQTGRAGIDAPDARPPGEGPP